MGILLERDFEHDVYVYRVGEDGCVVRPYLHKCPPCPELPELLRDHFGGGAFRVMVRRGRTMVFSAEVLMETLR